MNPSGAMSLSLSLSVNEPLGASSTYIPSERFAAGHQGAHGDSDVTQDADLLPCRACAVPTQRLLFDELQVVRQDGVQDRLQTTQSKNLSH